MPSEEFMKAVLESESARIARGEVPEGREVRLADVETEEDEEQPEPAPEEEEQGEEADAEDEVAEDESGVPEEDLPDDEGEADAEEEPLDHGGEDFYLEIGGARYRTKEEAERGLEETRRAFLDRSQRLSDAERERDELRQQIAYLQGRESVGGQQEFDEWADTHIERNPEQGMHQAIQASINSGDQSYAYAYTDRWAAVDPYQASIWRNRLETAIFTTASEPTHEDTNGADPVQSVINDTWSTLSEEYPDLRDDNIVRGMSETIRHDPDLRAAALTGDPAQVRLAFLAARRLVRSSQAAPRRVRKQDAEQVAREKREATMVTGDGAPKRRSSSPVMTAEEESILAGAAKLGLKRRDEEE